MHRVLLLYVIACILSITYAQFASLPCESYCNLKRQNGQLVVNKPVRGRCLPNGNPSTKYGYSCFCEDGFQGENCLTRTLPPPLPDTPHVNYNCMFVDEARKSNITHEIKLCGCSIGWGGPDCLTNCTQMINCTAPNICYYAQGEFKCACGKDRIGTNCEFDMSPLFQAHDLIAGYGFLVGYFVLFIMSILIFWSHLRYKGCDFKLFCIMCANLSTAVKFVMCVYNIVGVHWRYEGTKFGLFPILFDIVPLYASSLGSVIQLCCNVAIIFLFKHISDQVSEFNFNKQVSILDRVVIGAIFLILLGGWLVALLLSIFNVIMFNAILFLLALEILPIVIGFTIFGGQIYFQLRKNHDRKALKAFKFMKFLVCNNILLCILFFVMISSGIVLHILPEFIREMNPTIIDTVNRGITTLIYAIEILTFILMEYLMLETKAFRKFICCCLPTKKPQYNALESMDELATQHDNKLMSDDSDDEKHDVFSTTEEASVHTEDIVVPEGKKRFAFFRKK